MKPTTHPAYYSYLLLNARSLAGQGHANYESAFFYAVQSLIISPIQQRETAKALIRRALTDAPVKRAPTSYGVRKFLLEARLHRYLQQGRCRSSSPLLIIPLLQANTNLLDPPACPACLMCKEETQILEHWLQRCPNLDVPRQHTFGCPSPPPGVLAIDPANVLTLARATF